MQSVTPKRKTPRNRSETKTEKKELRSNRKKCKEQKKTSKRLSFNTFIHEIRTLGEEKTLGHKKCDSWERKQ